MAEPYTHLLLACFEETHCWRPVGQLRETASYFKYKSYRGRFDDGPKGFVIINTQLLIVTFGNKTRFISVNRAIMIKFSAEDLFTANDIDVLRWWWNNIPRLINDDLRVKLIWHGVTPTNIYYLHIEILDTKHIGYARPWPSYMYAVKLIDKTEKLNDSVYMVGHAFFFCLFSWLNVLVGPSYINKKKNLNYHQHLCFIVHLKSSH